MAPNDNLGADEHLTPVEVSERFKIPNATLAQWRVRGAGPPFYKIGKHVRYLSSECDSWFRAQRVTAA